MKKIIPDMEGSYECAELVVVDTRQEMALQPETWMEGKRTACYEMKDVNHIQVDRYQSLGRTCSLHISYTYGI
jgi:hypothetical protein